MWIKPNDFITIAKYFNPNIYDTFLVSGIPYVVYFFKSFLKLEAALKANRTHIESKFVICQQNSIGTKTKSVQREVSRRQNELDLNEHENYETMFPVYENLQPCVKLSSQQALIT